MPRKDETKYIQVYTNEKNIAKVHDLAKLAGKQSASEYILDLIAKDAAKHKVPLEPTIGRGKYEREPKPAA